MATLYRQYRPQSFAELVGQEHIRATLQAAVRGGMTAHAYLFAGPRGVGKTTVARLLAKVLNCETGRASGEPCNNCRMCQEITDGRALDVIEIDAASNRGIDEIRELRDKIKFAPSVAKTKVYIIDEVHMLTKEAFNALLKTLEEPPPHATFILATTELHRVPVTIRSRCQVFVFKRATSAEVAERLRHVAAAEQIAISPDATHYLAHLAGGSYRDALTLLDQIRSHAAGEITRSVIEELLGIPTSSRILKLIEALAERDREGALGLLQAAEADGVDLDHLVSQLTNAARWLLHSQHGLTSDLIEVGDADRSRWEALVSRFSTSELVKLITELATAKQLMKQTVATLLPLELTVVKFTDQTPPVKSDQRQVTPKDDDNKELEIENEKQPSSAAPQDTPTAAMDSQPQSPPSLTNDFWPTLLSRVRERNMGLYGLLQQAECGGVTDGQLHLKVPFAFARDRLTDRKHRELLLKLAEDLVGSKLELFCEVCPHDHVVHHPEDEIDPSVVAAAVEVFEIEETGAS